MADEQTSFHLYLKRRWRIAESRRHYFVLKDSSVCSESCLREVPVRYAILVVAKLQVKTAKDSASVKLAYLSTIIGKGYLSLTVTLFNPR